MNTYAMLYHEMVTMRDAWATRQLTPGEEIPANPAQDGFRKEDAAYLLTLYGKGNGSFLPTGFPAFDAMAQAQDVRWYYDGGVEEAPHFNPKDGTIHLPHPGAFVSPAAYAAMAAHELTHSTKVTPKMDRGFDKITIASMRDRAEGFFEMTLQVPNYVTAAEEWVAELGSMHLMDHFGIATDDTRYRSMHYLRAWYDNAQKEEIKDLPTSESDPMNWLFFQLNGGPDAVKPATPAELRRIWNRVSGYVTPAVDYLTNRVKVAENA